jgi:hypothetical protein
MRQITYTHKSLAVFSICLFVVVFSFTFGLGNWSAPLARGAANNWIGGETGDWNDAANWSDGIPTSDDLVGITATSSHILVTLQTAQTADFSTLTITGQDGGGYYVTTTLIGNLSTAGSITVEDNGVLEQENNVEQTITGTLTIDSGAVVTHTTNDSAHSYSLYMSMATLTANSGSSINVDYNGYGESSGGGDGPGGGGTGTGGSYDIGSGAGHVGDGGDGIPNNPVTTADGGVGYCTITGPTTPGSEGGWGRDGATNSGGDGGGLIRLTVSGTATLNGAVTADGAHGGTNTGGGSGGGIDISADTIAGTPTSFTATGGWSGDGATESDGGGGGGGCVLLSYTSSNSITGSSINVYGGRGDRYGGAGIAYLKSSGGDDDLFIINDGNNGTDPANTAQLEDSLSIDSMMISSSSFYVVTSSKSLTLSGSDPFTSESPSGTLKILDTATFTPNTSLTISSTTLVVTSTATLTSAASMDLTIDSGGVFEMGSFTTTSPLTISTLTINNGGTLTHSDNTYEQTSVVNLAATTITVNSGGTVSASEKGYDGPNYTSDGYGPGAGINGPNANQYGSGAGHGGIGGDNFHELSNGGASYCVSTNPGTIGSSGAGGGNAEDIGGDGGGYVKMVASGTLTVAGSILLDGEDGVQTSFHAGGGAGGGLYLEGNTVAIDNSTISLDGGSTGTSGGGGGGGCAYIAYGSSITDTGATTSTAAGTGHISGGTVATAGFWNVASLNAAPSAIAPYTPVQDTEGNGYVTVTTTITDTDDDSVDVFVDYTIDGGITWSSSTIATLTPGSGDPATSTGQITSVTSTSAGNTLTFAIDLSAVSTSTSMASVRIVPNDGTINGTSVTSTGFIVDTITPTVPDDLLVSSTSTTGVIIEYGSTTSTDDNFAEHKIFYKAGSSGVTSSDTAHASSTDANLGVANFSGATTTTISSLSANTQYVAEHYIYDDFGNVTTTASEVSFYTLANTPTIGVVSMTRTSITVNWTGDATAYYVNNITSGSVSGWTTDTSYTFSSLTCGVYYTIALSGRNGDLIETASAGTAYQTTECGGGGGGGGGSSSSQTTTPTDSITVDPVDPPADDTPKEDDKVDPPVDDIPKEDDKVDPPEEKKEIPKKPEVKKDPVKEVTKPTEKAETKKDADSKTDTAKDSQADSKPSDVGSSDGDDTRLSVQIEGAPVKLTNKPAVQVALDTRYPTVTLEDNEGRLVERTEVSDILPWEFGGEDGQKCITATFYDSSGRKAKQKVSCFTLDTIPPSPPEVRVKAKVIVDEVDAGQQITVRGTTEPFASLIVSAIRTGNIDPQEVAASLNPFRALIAQAAGGSFTTKADKNGIWSFTFPEAFNLGKYAINVQAQDEAGNVSEPAAVEVVVNTGNIAEKLVSAVGDFVQNPEVERVNEAYVAPAVILVGSANFVATGFQLPQIFVFLKFLFFQPVLLLRRRKHSGWGTVYNGFTKEPVDLASVRFINASTGAVTRSQVTDSQGRYFLMGQAGEYKIEVDKTGFGGISKHLEGMETDGNYARVYHGEAFSLADEKTEINYSVPVDPKGEVKEASSVIRQAIMHGAQHIVSLIGLGATAFSFAISPTPMVGGFLAVHIVFYGISHKFSKRKKPDTFGVVSDKKTSKGIKHVVVRVFDSAYDKLVDMKVTDEKGRYALLVGPSKCYVTYEKPGYAKMKSDQMDFIKKQGGLITRDEKLKRLAKGAGDISDIISQPAEKKHEDLAAHIAKRKEAGEAGEATGEHVDPEELIKRWKKDHGQHKQVGVQSEVSEDSLTESQEPPQSTK